MQNRFVKISLGILVVLILASVYLFWTSKYIPFNMDEFSQYHALGCAYYPNNIYNSFREGCEALDLAPIANHYLPLRSFEYTGSVFGLIYYPMFRIWPSPYSARFWGLLMLALQAFLIKKVFKINFILAYLGLLCFMPYAFQHLVDTGAVYFHTLSVFLLCYLIPLWVKAIGEQDKKAWIYSLSLGLIIFLGIWMKLSFFFMLPAVFILIFYLIFKARGCLNTTASKKTLAMHVVLAMVTAGYLSFILLNSVDKGGTEKYFLYITDSPKISLWDIPLVIDNFSTKLAKYFFNPLTSAHYVLEVPEGTFSISGILMGITVILFFLYGMGQFHQKKINGDFIFLNIGLLFLTLYLINSSLRSWAMHHVILCFPFFILAACQIISKLGKDKMIMIFLSIFFLVNIHLYYRMTQLPYQERFHPSLPKLNHVLNEQFLDQYVIVVFSWGLYYIKMLYGQRNQCVLYIDPFTHPDYVQRLRKILDQMERKPLFVGKKNERIALWFIRKNFPRLTESKIKFDTGGWGIWYE